MLMSEQCFHFVNNELFIKALPENDFLEELLNVNQQYPSKIEQILPTSLQKFAEGFSHQKGAISGYWVCIASITAGRNIEYMNQSKVPIHNSGEERNVGFFNYEI